MEVELGLLFGAEWEPRGRIGCGTGGIEGAQYVLVARASRGEFADDDGEGLVLDGGGMTRFGELGEPGHGVAVGEGEGHGWSLSSWPWWMADLIWTDVLFTS